MDSYLITISNTAPHAVLSNYNLLAKTLSDMQRLDECYRAQADRAPFQQVLTVTEQ